MTRRGVLVWVHDLSGVQVGVIGRDFRELRRDVTQDQSEVLSFAIPADHPKVYLLAEDREVRLDGRTYFVHELVQERLGSETWVRSTCNATWYRLGDHDHVGSLVVSDASVLAGAEMVLAGTGWSVDERTVATGDYSMETQDRSALANVRTWAKITGTFVEFDTQARTVAWVSSRGAQLGLAFRKGRNLRNVVRRRTPPRVTALFPYGRDDLTIAGVNGGFPYVEDASFYTAQGIDFDAVAPDGRTYRQRLGKRRVIRDQSFVKEADLLAWAQTELAGSAQSIQSVQLDVVDIAEITGVTEAIAVNDRCRAFDPDFDEEFSATVTRTVDHPLQPWRNEIELSTSPQVVSDPDSAAGRPQQSNEWIRFVGPVASNFQIRNDSVWTVARIPLRFREGGQAIYHLELFGVGVGDGVMHVEVFDAESEVTVWRSIDEPYSDGEPVRASLAWTSGDLTGTYEYRVRVTTTADGGPSPSNGVDFAADDNEDPTEESFWILAQGAVQETPTVSASEVFEFTNGLQQFTVPDNVETVTIEARGSSGTPFNLAGGTGGIVTATFPVIPGTVYDVYVPGTFSGQSAGHYPNGGTGGAPGTSGSRGQGGGGAAYVTPAGGSLAAALIVAGGGGGASLVQVGGNAGYFAGADGGGSYPGIGATQSAGGAAGGAGASAGDATGQGQGGNGANGAGTFRQGGGGGGGGWHGGGGGGESSGNFAGGGGGGSGYVNTTGEGAGTDILVSDGTHTGHGRVTFSWPVPVTV